MFCLKAFGSFFSVAIQRMQVVFVNLFTRKFFSSESSKCNKLAKKFNFCQPLKRSRNFGANHRKVEKTEISGTKFPKKRQKLEAH